MSIAARAWQARRAIPFDYPQPLSPKTPSFSSFHDLETSIQSMTSQLFYRTKIHERYCGLSTGKNHNLTRASLHRVSITELHHHHDGTKFPSFRASHHHRYHEQYYGSSTDLSQPWKNHNNGRVSQGAVRRRKSP